MYSPQSTEPKSRKNVHVEYKHTELSSSNGVSIAELSHNTSVADSAIEDDSTVIPSAVAKLGYKGLQKLCMDYGIGGKGKKAALQQKF